MDYHLQNVRSGETHSLNPNRTLIGLADHADVHTADEGSYLAALIVRYPSGWTIHGLSENPAALFNGEPLSIGRQMALHSGDVLDVGEEKFRFVSPRGLAAVVGESPPLPSCFIYVRGQDDQEECRAVDHDLLFGRLSHCHVRFRDSRLSRVAALLAAHEGRWFIHALSKGPIGRNRRAVTGFAPVDDGDELLIGPLVARVELRPANEDVARPIPAIETVEAHDHEASTNVDSEPTETAGHTVDMEEPIDQAPKANIAALKAGAMRLDSWLKGQTPTPPPPAQGFSGWLGTQKQKLNRFWFDTPDATAARTLRAAEKYDEAFALLDRAVRVNPGSPDLLRELYRLYEALDLLDLGYRPLRMIEKIASARGGTDPWVLETMARLCERLGSQRAGMTDRAIGYWSKLEKATGVSYAKERDAVRASRTLQEGGYLRTLEE